MLVSSPQKLSLTQVAVMAQEFKHRIAQIYLHWTAGRYGQVYDDYHLNIDADGTIYCTCSSCGLGAQANHGYDADLGQFSPTAAQTDKLAQVVAVLAKGLELSLQPSNVMTHCEAALLDGYGPYSGDVETRWDLWYMRDSPGDGVLRYGGLVLRGKALWYYSRLN